MEEAATKRGYSFSVKTTLSVIISKPVYFVRPPYVVNKTDFITENQQNAQIIYILSKFIAPTCFGHC